MTSSKLSALCDGIVEAGWLFAAATAPLFFNLYSGRGIEPGKLALVRSIVAVMAAAWFIQWLDQRRTSHSPAGLSWRTPLVRPTLFLVAATLLSTFTSLVPRISFFGEYVRPEGAHAVLAYAVLFLITLQGLRTRAQLDRLVTIIALTSLPVALYAVVQKLGLDPITWGLDVRDRTGATLGNPIFLGAYLLTTVFLTLGVAVTDLQSGAHAQTNSARLARRLRAGCLILIMVVQVIALVLSASRGPWVGGMAGLFLLGLLSSAMLRRRRLVVGSIVVGAAVLLSLTVLNLPDSPLSSLRTLPTLGRLGYLFDSESGSSRVRTLIWEGNAQLILSGVTIQFPDGTSDRLALLRTIVGHGPDSLYLVFRQVAPPQLAQMSGADTLTTRSHNETWDVWVTTGLVGLAAYQLLFLSVFLHGLTCLGLASRKCERNLFVGLWLGLGLVGGLVTVLINQAKYLGLGLPAGNVAGLVTYLVMIALTRQTEQAVPSNDDALPHADRVLIATLLAGLLAHYIEIQFGHAVTATRVMFWLSVAILGVLGTGRLAHETAPVSLQPAWRRSASYALIAALLLSTLLYEFVNQNNGLANPLSILWQALTLNPGQNSPSYAIVGLIGLTWAASAVFAHTQKTNAPTSHSGGWMSLVLAALLSMGLALAFGLGLASQLGKIQAVPIPVARLEDVVNLASQLTRLFNTYVASLFALLLLSAAALSESRGSTLPWVSNKSGLFGLIPVVLATTVWIHAFNTNPMRATMFYELGQEYDADPNAAIALYKRAIALTPYQDFYYPALGNAYVYKGHSAPSQSAARFNGQTRLEDIFALDAQRAADLNRLDLLYAAQAVFVRASTLNRLHVDHRVNLARFYLPELPVNSPSRAALADLADQYYAQAVRLAPTDVTLWNEWADFYLQYKNDPKAAMEKLGESVRLDGRSEQTQVYLGKAYTQQQDWDQAIAAYQRAFSLQPHLAEAHSRLAYAYYQKGDLEHAVLAYQTYIQVATDSSSLWEAHKNLALIYAQMGDLHQALNQMQTASSLAPSEARSQIDEIAARWKREANTP